MDSITLEDLSIHKFQPDNILMIHKHTKNVYQYFQTPVQAVKQKNILHDHLLQPTFIATGLIYEKGVTSMNIELAKRIKASNKQYFQQQQLVNTFSPILECLLFLHSKQIVHGSICTENIIFDDEGDVLLRDWLIQVPNNKYYEIENIKDRTKNDDICALGLILLEASSLTETKLEDKSISIFQNILKNLAFKYSRGFILAIYVMIKKVEKFYTCLQKLLKNNDSYIDSQEQLKSIFKKIKGQKDFKPAIGSSLLNQFNLKYLDFINKTSIPIKKNLKIQDAENKKIFEDVKKKGVERVGKIVDKSSHNQMGRKLDMALKKVSNMKLSNCQQNQKKLKKVSKEDILKFSSPMKRLKTASKKKAF